MRFVLHAGLVEILDYSAWTKSHGYSCWLCYFPVSDFASDPFAVDVMRDPYPYYKVLRDGYPVYWLDNTTPGDF